MGLGPLDTPAAAKMRVALYPLASAEKIIFSAVDELEQQGFVAEAAGLQAVLTSLTAAKLAAQAAVEAAA